MRIGFDAAARDAQTPQQYVAAQMALCLEQTGCLPEVDEIVDYLNMDDEFAVKFRNQLPVTEDRVYKWLMAILKLSMV